MKINDRPFVFKYTNNEKDIIAFVINPEKSDERRVETYAQFINGLFTGSYYSITEIHRLMDNGYDWKTI